MPVLPVDYPEPFAAVLGTMLYPNEGDAAQSSEKESRRITTMPTILRVFLRKPRFFGNGARHGKLMLRRPNHRCPLGHGLCQRSGLRHHGSLVGHRPA